jgi:hypothetical protein
MRDYIGELLDIGFSPQAVAARAGVSQQTINKIISGQTKLKSGSKTYESIRNVNRTLAREYLRQNGMSSSQADKFRRYALNPKMKSKITNTTVKVKSHHAQYLNQYYIYGEFYNEQTKETRYQTGGSGTLKHKNYSIPRLRSICVKSALRKLSGRFAYDKDWKLVKIFEEGWVTYEIKDIKT